MAPTTAGGFAASAATLDEGRRAFAAGDYSRSEEILVAALAAGANERDCRLPLARIANLLQQWPKALEHWQWLRNWQPTALEPQLQVARALFRLQRFEEAAAEFRRVVEIEPGHAEAVKRLAHIDDLSKPRPAPPREDQPSEAPHPASSSQTLAPEGAPVIDAASSLPASQAAPSGQSGAHTLLEEGKAAFKAQQFALSRKLFTDALEAGADEGVCRLYLARIHNLDGEWSSALLHWQWLGARSPEAVEPRLQVGRALFRLKRRDEARAAFEAVLALQPDHPEALRRLKELQDPPDIPEPGTARDESAASAEEGRVTPSDGIGQPSSAAQPDVFLPTEPAGAAPDVPVSRAIMADAREAFRRQDYAHAEALFLQALAEGADEPVCRLHLARIYNHGACWAQALEQWQWLQGRNPRQLEPNLQVGRALHRLGRLAEAAAAFQSVLDLEADHAEARQRLQQISEVLEEEWADAQDRRSWLSLPAEALRWRLAGDVLGGGVGSLGAMIGRAFAEAEALARAIEAVSDAGGPHSSHRQLYGVQASGRVAELMALLKEANDRVRDLSRRTEKLFLRMERSSGHAAAPLRSTGHAPPRSLVRHKIEELIAAVRAEQGVDAALAALYREALVEDRSGLLSSLGTALHGSDLASAVRTFWLAYGADPTPSAARRAAVRMFRAGDLSSASTLLDVLPEQSVRDLQSAFGRTMISTLALFRNGVTIPPRADRNAEVARGTLGYVVSGALPFQVAGYSVRTQALLDSLPAVGIRPICFTQPGFPWDRPHLLTPGQDVPLELTVGRVLYRHTPWPEQAAGIGPVETAAEALAGLFREHSIETVQAASNNRNALPALIAARVVGAKFVYEVRGLWELTAAARLPGWEETERYRFDRELETRIATEADHVLAITQGIADELIAGGVPAARISLLPNAVDPEVFAPVPKDGALAARLGLRDGDFVVVYAGTLSSYEGLDDLVEAIALLCRQDVPARLLLVGEGQFRANLEALSQARGQTGNVFFAGRVEPDEVRRYLSLADAVAIPRKPHRVCQIVSPLKPFEAMAMEKPVVLTDLRVLREIVDHGRTGLICRAADPTDLAAALLQLARSPTLRQDLGRAARQWVIDERSWSHNARTLGALYTRLNDRHGETEAGGAA